MGMLKIGTEGFDFTGGVIDAPSSSFCKHPRNQVPDQDAHPALEAFIAGDAPATGTRH